MICPICDGDTKVLYTEQDYERNRIMRKRECIECGFRFFSEENFKYPVKKDKYILMYEKAMKERVEVNGQKRM